MLRFTPLPFIENLKRLAADNEHRAILGQRPQATMEEVRSAELRNTLSTPGFQLVVETLRQLEFSALDRLRNGIGNHDRLLGRIECLEELRRTLAAMLGVTDRDQLDAVAGEASEDWFLDAGGEDE